MSADHESENRKAVSWAEHRVALHVESRRKPGSCESCDYAWPCYDRSVGNAVLRLLAQLHPPAQVVEAAHGYDLRTPGPPVCLCGVAWPCRLAPIPTDPARKPAECGNSGPMGVCRLTTPHSLDACVATRRPLDEDEAAARDLCARESWTTPPGLGRIEALARFRATAREQGRQAGLAEAALEWSAIVDVYVKQREEWFAERDSLRASSRQAGAEAMREACAKAAERFTAKAERPLPQVHPSERLVGRRCGEVYAGQTIVAAIRALPLPEPGK